MSTWFHTDPCFEVDVRQIVLHGCCVILPLKSLVSAAQQVACGPNIVGRRPQYCKQAHLSPDVLSNFIWVLSGKPIAGVLYAQII